MTALEGLRVVDQTQVMAGPTCTMLLADMGAEVIKIEPPGGEHMRRGELEIKPGLSASFLAVNRGKRGVVIDLRSPAGRAALHRLVADADVVVHSFAPGVAERIGAGADELMALNPRLVYCSLSAFGPQGRRGTDVALQSESGLVAANGGRVMPVPAHDTVAPWIMVAGILAALLERARVLVAESRSQRLHHVRRQLRERFERCAPYRSCARRIEQNEGDALERARGDRAVVRDQQRPQRIQHCRRERRGFP